MAASLSVGRAFFSRQIFLAAVDRLAGVDESDSFADGLTVYVCGSGSPLRDMNRAGPCLGVLAGSTSIIIDSGSGSSRKLTAMGFPFGKLHSLFLTHLHSDHIDGLGETLNQAWMGGSRSEPLPVYGPAGVDIVLKGLTAMYSVDRGFRLDHHSDLVAPRTGGGGAARLIELADGEAEKTVLETDQGLKVTVIRVEHGPVRPAFGYRVDYRGRSIAVSGDTVFSTNLARGSRNVDVLFHEALNRDMMRAIGAKLKERGKLAFAQVMEDVQNYHTTPEEAAQVAEQANATVLILHHLIPSLPSRLLEPMFLGDSASHFKGTIKIAHDGMMVSLPTGSKAINFWEKS